MVQSEKKLSCSLLRHQLIFMHHGVYPCCAINDGKNPLLAKLSENIYEMLEEISATRKEIERKLTSGEKCICSNCSYVDIVDENVPNDCRFMILTEATHCNFRCNYCHNFNSGKNFEPARAIMFEIIKNFYQHNILSANTTFQIAGGEPFLMPDFEQAIEMILNMSQSQIDVRSNLSTFSKVMVRALLEKRAIITTSIDAGTPETFKEIKGVDKFSVVLKNAKRYAQINPDRIIIKFICLPENVNEVNLYGLLNVLNMGFERLAIAFDCMHYDTIPDEFMEFAGKLKAYAICSGIIVDVDYGEGNQGARDRHLKAKVESSFSRYMTELAPIYCPFIDNTGDLKDGDTNLNGWIDRIMITEDKLRIEGWAWDKKRNDRPYVCISIGNRAIYLGKTWHIRDDVQIGSRSGFIFELADFKITTPLNSCYENISAFASHDKILWNKLNINNPYT